ncbi:carboxylesterase family protein [Mobilitalea sibirica]|uniref:Carboxylic ester hydrolase n=1 Tax=Mobilitalea sibirica TaxID=1462919 RepID=A0A8J7KX87_9FIRM|nr:carboxylesterase family protein [Mobilitalea sibirica]MBH1942265.1 carboxylesterase family protein [Mobilitalea sibirica]
MIRTAITENGIVRGIEAADPRITAFKGIPFAAPPVGENRWRAPKPCPNWEGILDAYRFAPISVQDTPGIGEDIYCREWHVDPDIVMDEDCLYLNIWTGAKSVEEKQPVLVWFFGGALQWGYPAEMEFDGERIARRGVIVVTVNYRLNVFGFMAHPEITAEEPLAPANFGHLDQQAGLRWVVRNISAFGGDPKNITIAGQSAGGGSVLVQMTCPDNFGLFQKAIVQSAMIHSPYKDISIGKPKTLSEAEQLGIKFFDFIGVKSLAEARKLDPFYLRDMYANFVKSNERMFNVIDGKFCIGYPLSLYMKNKHAMVPVMSGNTSDEFLNSISVNSEDELTQKAKELFGPHSEEFLNFEETWKKNENHYATVSGIECSVKSLFLQNQELDNPQKCFYYRFDADIPGWDKPGNFHSVDLWFFFETLAKCWRPFTGKHYDLARLMCNYMCNFIKNGDPNGKDADGSDMPYWSPYTKETPCDMLFSSEGACPEIREESPFIQFLMDRISEDLKQKEA